MISVFDRIRVRIFALILFFIDCKVISFCFTISIELVLLTFLLQKHSLGESEFPIEAVAIFTTTQLFLVLVSYGVFRDVQNTTTYLKLIAISVLLTLPISLTYSFKTRTLIEKVQSFIGQEVSISATVESIEGGGKSTVGAKRGGLGKILVQESSKTVLHVGDRCIFKGKLVEPKSYEDFDYKKYLYRKGIYSILQVTSIECSKNKSFLLAFRSNLEEVVESLIPEPESSLLIGVMLGTKREFTDEFDEIVRNAGVSHIVAASGYNVSILLVAVEKIFGFLKSKSRVVAQLTLVWIYTVMAGLSASLLRASTMSSIYLFSVLISRPSSRHIGMFLCITALLLLKPFLIFDIGFLLSLTATLSLIYFLPSIDSEKVPKIFRNYLFPTLSCTLFTLPVSIVVFGTLSTVSVLANFLVLPIIESTMIWGLLSVLTYLIFPSFNLLFTPPYLQLLVFKYVITLLSPIKSVELVIKPVVLISIAYTLLFTFCLLKYPIENEKRNYYFKKALQHIHKSGI